MPQAEQVAPGDYVPTADMRVFMHVPWAHFEAILALRGDVAGPRMAYLDGVVEFMSPSKSHERFKSYIGRLVETYAMEVGIDLSPYGSWTLKYAPREAGVEPDECYLIGDDQDRQTPDLAIEVAWTRGGINKLEIYRRLGVREVWFWQDEQIAVFVLAGDAYQHVEKSACFPGLDLALLCSFLHHPTVTQAARAFRAALRH
jgi:Uma2 family endonuclease